MRRWIPSLCIVALAIPAAAAGEGPGATAAAKFKRCTPPANTFYKSLKVKGIGCGKGRFVLTHVECDNPSCSKLSYRSWECVLKGGIAFRRTRCVRGNDRIVATARGD